MELYKILEVEVKEIYTLIYDHNCDFCSGLAQRIGRYANIKTVPASKSPNFGGLTREHLLKDVHLIQQVQYDHGKARFVFVGAAAAAKVMSIKHPFIWSLYSFWPCKVCFRSLYFLLKKSRKYLYMVWSD